MLFRVYVCVCVVYIDWFELLPFTLIGISGGLFGALFIKLNTSIAAFRQNSMLCRHPMGCYIEVFCVALITAALKYLSSYTRGNNNSMLAALFGDCDEAYFYDPLQMCDMDYVTETLLNLLYCMCMTFCFTMFTWSLTVPGGIFLPSLLIGACYGRIVGTGMRYWQAQGSFSTYDPFTPGIYALVGAASMLAGVTRMTVCLVVIMYEITGGLEYMLPITVAIMFAKIVGDALDRRSIFEAHLQLNHYPFLNSKDRIAPYLRVSDAMSCDLLMLPMHGHTIETLNLHLKELGELQITGFPIVTTLQERLVVGYIDRSELYAALEAAIQQPDITLHTRCYFGMLSLRFPRNEPFVDLRPWLHPSPIQLVEQTPLYRVFDMFTKLGLRYALVTRFGRLVGIITKKDLLAAIELAKYERRHRRRTISHPAADGIVDQMALAKDGHTQALLPNDAASSDTYA